MPRVKPLTEAQRKKERCQIRSKALADGLAVFKNREGLTHDELGEQLKISRNTVAKLLAADDIRLPITTVWQLLDMAGLELRQKPSRLEN